MNQLVLDTNVLVSGLINAFGAPGRIVDLLRTGNAELVVDDRIVSEYADVLHRPKFRRYFSLHEADDILKFLVHNTLYVVPTRQAGPLPDPDDTPFLETALTASVPLVTGNTDHFPTDRRQGIAILSPAEFLATLTD
jgi:putative PIN family toxin of toxin-antitoxin system